MSEKAGKDHPWKAGVREDLLVWAGLLILLAITFCVSFAPWGVWSTLVSFTASAAKTALIAYFYMHLKREKGMTRIFALGGVAWLMILFSLTLSDYATRGWLPYPSQWPIFIHLRPALHEGAAYH
jgi:cytochrome c oxidase subunit 4